MNFTQLHPNSWGFICNFELLCESLLVVPMVDALFYFLRVCIPSRDKDGMTWTSLSGRFGKRFLSIFEDSFKNFKDGFFQITSHTKLLPFLKDKNECPKFPLYLSHHVSAVPEPSKMNFCD